jgi:uncharacterized membrane protein
MIARSCWALWCIVLFLVLTPSASAESIVSFSATYTINADGTVDVVEDIVYDFGDEERHGIFRTIETDHPQPASAWYKDRYIGVEVFEVLHNGREPRYETTARRNDLSLRIGDPERTITGTHEYRVAYTLTGALSYGTDGAEFYWNVTGNEWSVPMGTVTARILADPALLSDERDCYVGVPGATDRCSVTTEEDGAVTFAAQNLPPGSELTIAHAVNSDALPVVKLERGAFPTALIVVGLVLFSGILLIAYLYRRHQSKHMLRVPVIAQYEPYQGALPMYAGVLMDGALDPRDITAGLVYLAQQGYLHIRHLERASMLVFTVSDYVITLRKDVGELKNEFLTEITRLLFGSKAYSGATSVGTQVVLSEVLADVSRQQKNQDVLRSLQKSVEQSLLTEGYFETTRPSTFVYVLLFGPIMLSTMLVAVGQYSVAFLIFFGLFFVAVIVAVVFRRRRTKKGYEALWHLKGFKEFLSVTDQERFRFHNAPAKNPETFMAYLPYAVAFGVENEWAKVFEGITIPTPDWYEGVTPGTFHAAAFAHDLGAFSSSFSSASGTSGSSGGGGAGGGGGGGGGGSW